MNAQALRTVWLILRKDVLTELRTREVVATMGLFSVLVVVVFAFALSVDESRAAMVAPGIVWVVILFATTLGLGRVFDRERDNDCLTALCLAPAGPQAVWVAKALGVFLFALLTELLTVPLMLVFLGVQVPLAGVGLFTASIVLGTAGIACVGTLFSGMLVSARLRDLVLPVVLYPVVVPVIIGGVEVCEIALRGGFAEEAFGWLQLMLGFDLVFAVLPPWIFARVMVD